MQNLRSIALPRLLILLAGLVILRVTASVLLNYRNYFPPNFEVEFLAVFELSSLGWRLLTATSRTSGFPA